MKCIGVNTDGALCSRNASRETGYCPQHDPKKTQEQKKRSNELVLRREEEDRQQRILERQEYELSLDDALARIREIKDLDTLRKAEQSVALGLAKGSIDPKAGSPICQLLKHQAELLEKTKPPSEKLDEGTARNLLKMSAEMTLAQMWGLMQDFTGGFARMKHEATKAITEQPVDAEVIQVEDKRERISNGDRERKTGIPTSGQCETDVF